METGEIKKTLLDYYEAFHNKEWDRFADFLTDNFRYFTDKTIVRDKENFVDFLSKDTWQGKSYSVDNIEINSAGGGDLAWGRYRTTFQGTENNNEYTVTAIETSIFEKINGMWKISHHHTSNKV
jgi:ketosteroid isomerase-like protein